MIADPVIIKYLDFPGVLLSLRLGFRVSKITIRFFVPDDFPLDHVNDVLGNVGDLVGNALQVTGDGQQGDQTVRLLRGFLDSFETEIEHPPVQIIHFVIRLDDFGARSDRLIPLQVGFGSPDPLLLGNMGIRIWNMANYFVRSLVFSYDQLWGGALDALIYPLEGIAFLLLLILGLFALQRLDWRIFWVFLAALALNVCGYLIFNVRYFQAEARLLIPALPFILISLVLGTNRLAGKNKNRAYILLGLWVALPWVGALR